MFLYAALAVAFLVVGRVEYALAYLMIVGLFCVTSIGVDWFTPITIAAHTFGLYFLAVMAFQNDILPPTLHYVVLTLALFAAGYLLTPTLEYKYVHRMTSNIILREDVLGKALLMLAIGVVLFLISTKMAGFSNPLQVFSAPLQYRFYMMIGGMSYLRIVIDICVNAPVLIVAITYYKGNVPLRWFVLFCAAGVLYGLASGSRGNLIILICEVLIFRHILRRRLSAAMTFAMIALAIPFIAIMGEYRNVKSINSNISISAVVRTLDLKDMVTLTLARFDAAHMFNELMTRDYAIPTSMGRYYAEIPLQAIPRSWWSSKPYMPNPAMTRITGYNDGMTDVAFDFGIFGETFINFKWFGCFFGAVMLVGIIGLLQSFSERALQKREVLNIVICALCWLVPYEVIVAGVVETSVTTASTLIYLVVIRFAFMRRERMALSSGMALLR